MRKNCRAFLLSDHERGQMLLGGALFLLLAAIVATALMRVAFEDVAALEDLDTTRDALLKESSLQAARLNEVAMNQSLVLWHLGGALRAQLEFAEGSLLSAATRPYNKTQEGRASLAKDAAYAFFRNALSLRSSRHFESAGTLLVRNSEILAAVEARSPGFLATLQEHSIGDAFCKVGKHWGNGQALSFPLLALLTKTFAGATSFSFNADRCAFELAGHMLAQRGNRETLLSLDSAWQAFASERLAKGIPTPPLFLPRPGAKQAWQGILRIQTMSPRARFRVEVVCEHPLADSAAALLSPSWAAFPSEVRREKSL
ncbi:MAG: hypothetical protein IOD12_02915 [Silvanigrellales bacterium]|nr:hypothetical protein [Silvanigrellales bacterium]